MKNQKGLSLIELLLFAALIALLLVLGVLLVNNERAKTRDAVRLADITQFRYAFEVMFFEKNSYQEASTGCSKINDLASQCSLTKYLPEVAKIADPGKFSYKISQIPSDQNFEITFYLEKGYNGLKAGKHTLSKDGIK